jgi:hypothetical protein
MQCFSPRIEYDDLLLGGIVEWAIAASSGGQRIARV